MATVRGIPGQDLCIYSDMQPVTLHDTNKIGPTRGLYIGTNTGTPLTDTLKVTTAGGNDVTLTGIKAGTAYTVSVIRVWSTGTTVSNVVALY